MKFLAHGIIVRHFSALFVNHTRRELNHTTLQLKQFVSLTNKRQVLRCPMRLSPITYVCYSDEKKQFIQLGKKSEALKDAFQHKKEQLRDTEHRIRQRGEEIIRDIKHQKEVTEQKFREKKDHLVQDILETKAKVKERFEGVVEVIFKIRFWLMEFVTMNYKNFKNISRYENTA